MSDRKIKHLIRKWEAEGLIAAISDGLSIQDRNFRILYQNEVHKNFKGDHVGELCYRAYEGKNKVCRGCPAKRAFKDGMVHRTERSVHINGNIFYFDITASPLKNPKGEIIGVIEIMRDITDSRTAITTFQNRLQAIRKIGDSANNTLNLNKVLKTILKGTLEATGATVGMIFLKNPVTGLLTWGASIGLSNAFVREFAEHPIRPAEGLTGRIAENGKPIYIREKASRDKRVARSAIEREGFNSFIGVPIYAANEIIGVMNILTRPPDILDEHEVTLATAICAHVGSAIRNAQLFEERRNLEKLLIEIEERERRRIGQDLHDSLGQLLAGIAFKLHGLERSLEKVSQKEAEEAADILLLVDDAKEQVSRLSKGLAPAGIHSEDLMAALESLALHATKIFKIPCYFICDKPVAIYNQATVIQFYRIAQEAVTNAAKHASPDYIIVVLTKKNGDIYLTIKDNGIGIADASKHSSGIGLKIMKHRASIINATLDIRRDTGGGTIVTCICPDNS